jgi:hypothetical protein
MDSLEYIDDYYQGPRSPEETRQFEQRILEDPAFAQELAFYLGSMQAARDIQNEDKKARFRDIYQQQPILTQARPVRKLWTYIAAAAVMAGVIFGVMLFTRPASRQELADHYIDLALQDMSGTMGREDSLQTGLKLYQEGKFPEALQQFEIITRSDSTQYLAKKYIGLTLLRMKKYDSAVDFFRQMAASPFYANPGPYYEALALMKRNLPGDDALAKQLLEQVDKQELDQKQAARELLRKWK